MRVDLSFANALIVGIDEADSIGGWLVRPLDWLVESKRFTYVAIATMDISKVKILCEDGQATSHHLESSIRKCLDFRQRVVLQNLVVVPIVGQYSEPCAMVFQPTQQPAAEAFLAEMEEVVEAISEGIDSWTLLARQKSELRRLREVLAIAVEWQAKNTLEELLKSMAQGATQLLNADRASIFLWDRPAKQLVGHPALGIEDQPLRVPEDAGLVGAVRRTLEPRRWDRESPSDEVDRSVDSKFGYQTDSLIAVPILDKKRKCLGVFEVLNHSTGKFSLDDQTTLEELAKHAAAALTNTQRMQELIATRERLTRDIASQSPLMGNCQPIESLKKTISRVAPTDLAVLILGENGTGKEVVARNIHFLSDRRHEPFVAVNCAAITETLLESELFGHEKGAFTDALESRAGKFEVASGGTLFLDEIGDMSPGGQGKLLRVLEEKVVVKVGGSKTIPVDVRVVAATNQNLVELVQAKKFREDLYFRLTVVTLDLPPLRVRGTDIIELAKHFLESYCAKIQRKPPTFSKTATDALMRHSWPGNVRKLRNLMERLVYLTDSETIEPTDLDFVRSPMSRTSSASSEIDLSQTLTDATAIFQTKVIERHIEANQGNMTEAARSLGLQRSNLYRKIKQLGISTDV